MGEISNKTLAILVVIAIIVSLIGLYLGRARIITVGKPIETGEVLADVEANINIEITPVPSNIDFGIVYAVDRVSSESVCNEVADPTCLVQASHTWDADCPYGAGTTQCNRAMPSASNDRLTVTSLGTTATNIGYRGGQSIFCNKLDQSPNAVRLEEDDSFMAKVKDSGGADACNGGIAVGWPAASPFWKQVDISATNVAIVSNCLPNDYFNIWFKINVPSNEPASEVTCPHTTTLTFEGTPFS